MLDLTIRSICPPIPAFVLALAAALPAQAGGVMVIGDRPPGSAPSSGVVAATGGDEFAVALRADGSLFAWGDPIHGQTGVPTGTGFAEIATGSNHGIARRNDGTLVGWGRNQLGQRTVPSGTFTRIAAADDHSLGIRSNGTLAAWGDPSDG
ncbi:MAG: hypothetical protein ACO38W_04835, partial [Phycisphaerales bacterium]